ncbi:MAG TPA: transposase, partial [Bellilinea sp.]|nr:transposase [Bellilinea sp.]
SRNEPTVELSLLGSEVVKSINYINQNSPGINIEQYVIMPNHVHLLIVIECGENKISLSDVVRRLKSFTTRQLNQIYRTENSVLWQRSFYDHVIRDPDDYANVQNYIDLNPWKWKEDDYYSKD